MKAISTSLIALLGMTSLSVAQAPVADAADSSAVLADIALLQTVDPTVTGSTKDAAQIDRAPNMTPPLQLCGRECQLERLNKWRDLLQD